MEDEIQSGVENGVEASTKRATENMLQTLGSWVNELALGSEWYVNWRMKNLVGAKDAFEEAAKKNGLSDDERNSIKPKFGLAWVESASQEDEPSLQKMWAKLLLSACKDGANGSDTFIYIDLLKKLSPIDVKLVNAIRGVNHFHIHSNDNHDKSILKIVELNDFQDISIEKIYEASSRLCLAGLVQVGTGGRDCFHSTVSLESLMNQIEPRGVPITNPRAV